MYHTADLTAKIGALADVTDLSDRLLTELEHLEAKHLLAGPVTTQDSAAMTVGARFCIDGAATAEAALAAAAAAFAEALASATGQVITAPAYTQMQIIEEQ